MSAAALAEAMFPRRYAPGAWAPAVGLMGAFLLLEALLHGRQPVQGSLAGDVVYGFGYGLLPAPFLMKGVREAAGAVRRLLVGWTILLVLGAGAVLGIPIGWGVEPCLLTAAALLGAWAARRWASRWAAVSAAVGSAAVAGVMLATGRHGPADILLGAALGALAAKAAGALFLSFLGEEGAAGLLALRVGDLANLFVRNDKERWEAAYDAGGWRHLEGAAERPRHYVIAGLISDRFPAGGARILDAGCGYGTLWPLTRHCAASYVGLDLAVAAVDASARAHGADGRCRFVIGAFEDYLPSERFDVVVMNELLYYLPLPSVAAAFRRALSLLADERSILVVSMDWNPKARLVWFILSRLAEAESSIRVGNAETGDDSTVRVFCRGRRPAKEAR